VGGSRASLVLVDRQEEEVVLPIFLLLLLDKSLVDDAARAGVSYLALGDLEESLDHSLVDHDDGDFWREGRLVVEFTDDLVKLGDLVSENLFSLFVTYSVAVDDKVGGVLVIVVLSEDLNRRSDQLTELGRAHKLLVLVLDQVVREVLTHLFVSGCCKSDCGVLPLVADINSNQHGSLFVEGLGEPEVEEVTTHFTVDLPQDVSRLRQVKPSSVLRRHDLRGNLQVLEYLLVHVVVIFIAENDETHGWVSEALTLALVHVVQELFLQFILIVFPGELYPVGLFHRHLQSSAGFFEVAEDCVGVVKVPFFVNKEPLLKLERYGVLDGQVLESPLVARDAVFALLDQRGVQHP